MANTTKTKSNTIDSIEDNISATKVWLSKSNKFPFFGYILFMLKPRKTEKAVPTMGVGLDGQYLYYGENFVSKLNKEELRATLLHESLHLALDHLWRIGARDRNLWNISADISINNEINNYAEVTLPKGALLDNNYNEWSAEEIYSDLQKKINKNKNGKIKMGFADGKGGQANKDVKIKETQCSGVGKSHSKWYDETSKNNKARKKWKRIVRRATEVHANKQQGKLPGELQRLVDEAMPKVDWREILANYVVKSCDDFGYRRPDKRFLDSDFIMPSMEEGEKIDKVVISIDTSGSISEEQLNKFAGEVKGLLKAFKNVKAYMCSVDTMIYDWKELDDYQINIQYFGGGGTDYRCIFDEIEKRNINPSVLIVMGDMYASFPEKEPNYDVIWLVTKDHGDTPGWGRKILYRD